jgi:hypothetical protein
VKLVIQDVSDHNIDAAAFIAASGLKLFALRQGDYNGSGCVDAADYVVWRDHFQAGTWPATFYHGDGNGNGVVDQADYTLWQANFGLTGNKDCRGDFDRDGDVDMADYNIWNTYDGVLQKCASRFEGDADGDGDVDNTDLTIWYGEFDFGCGCSGGGAAMMAGGGTTVDKEDLPESPDIDGDGDVDESDFAAIEAILFGSTNEPLPVEDSAPAGDITEFEPQPTPALPLPEPSESNGPQPKPAPADFPPNFPGHPPDGPR